MPQIYLNKQKKEALMRMNQNAEMVGSKQLTESEIDRYNHLGDTTLLADQNADLATKVKEQLSEIMLYDTQNAEILKDEYADAYSLAQQKMKDLNVAATRSGVAKVKSDMLGFKKRAAAAKLASIQANKKKIEAKNEKRIMEEYKEQFEKAKEETERELQADPTNSYALYKKSRLSAVGGTGKTVSLLDYADALRECTREEYMETRTQEQFCRVREIGEDGTPVNYNADNFYRDMVKLVAPYRQDCTTTDYVELSEKVDKYAESANLVRFGETIQEAHKKDKTEPTEAQKKEKEQKIRNAQKDLRELCMFKAEEILSNLEGDELLAGGAEAYKFEISLTKLSYTYKKTQALSYLSLLLSKESKEFGTLPKDEQLKFAEARVKIKAIMMFTAQNSAMVRRRSIGQDANDFKTLDTCLESARNEVTTEMAKLGVKM